MSFGRLLLGAGPEFAEFAEFAELAGQVLTFAELSPSWGDKE